MRQIEKYVVFPPQILLIFMTLNVLTNDPLNLQISGMQIYTRLGSQTFYITHPSCISAHKNRYFEI